MLQASLCTDLCHLSLCLVGESGDGARIQTGFQHFDTAIHGASEYGTQCVDHPCQLAVVANVVCLQIYTEVYKDNHKD